MALTNGITTLVGPKYEKELDYDVLDTLEVPDPVKEQDPGLLREALIALYKINEKKVQE